MVNYLERKPVHKELLPYVKGYVQVIGDKLISKSVPPQLNGTIAFDLSRNTLYNGRSFKTVVVGHQDSTFRLDALSPTNDKLLIKFSPYGLSVFLKTPLNVLNNEIIEAETLFDASIERLYRAMQDTPSLSARIDLLETYFLKRFTEPSPAQKMIFSLADSITAQADTASLHALKHAAALSQRQIERIFKKTTGITIGQYSRLTRFEKARKILDKSSFNRLTDVAYASGYYDQSHFISDFKRLAGSRPGEYRFC